MNALATHWLPTDPPRPCPDVLTAEEAAIYLRLDRSGVKDPLRTLAGYRERGQLIGVQIGRRICYRRQDLDRFIDNRMKANPR